MSITGLRSGVTVVHLVWAMAIPKRRARCLAPREHSLEPHSDASSGFTSGFRSGHRLREELGTGRRP